MVFKQAEQELGTERDPGVHPLSRALGKAVIDHIYIWRGLIGPLARPWLPLLGSLRPHLRNLFGHLFDHPLKLSHPRLQILEAEHGPGVSHG
jgi:hypothetical protein